MTKKNAPTKKKIKRCLNPFDRTSIHPESYIIAQKLLQSLKLTPDLIGSKKIAEVTRKLNPKGISTAAKVHNVLRLDFCYLILLSHS